MFGFDQPGVNMKKLVLFILCISSFLGLHAESKTALVAGGAGFLGSHLCDRLLEKGYQVVCVDNLATGSLDNIAHLKKNPCFSFIEHDVTEPLTPPCKVDEIYNLASPASPVHYQKDPIQTLKTNVFGSLMLLEIAKQHQAKFFQASTSEVYGDPIEHPQVESHWGNVNPIGIRACYDEGKRCGETACFDYHRQYGVAIKVGRIFNTYGPRMDRRDGRVVSNFIVQALNGDPITIYGDGLQTRAFCYVDDLIDAIMALMNTEEAFTGPVNIGNPGEFTVLELAEKVLQLTGAKSKLVFEPLPQDDPQRRRPDLTLAKEVLGWSPKVKLIDGLEKTVSYFEGSM